MRILHRITRLVPPKGERLLPALAGLLLVLSFPPFSVPGLPFVAMVPLVVFIAERPDDPTGRWSATRAGFVAGLIYFGLLLYWLLVALIYYSALAIPAYVLTTLILAGFTAVFATALHRVRHSSLAVPTALAAALLWTALEWVQGHLGDVAFPWLGLGSSLAAFPGLAGAADLVGARGLTFWLALVNGIAASAVLAVRGGGRAARTATLAVVVAAAPAVYGFVRAATLETRPAARVAVVQPNIPEDLKLDRARGLDSSMTALANLTRRIPAGSVDVVIWPEVAVPAALQYSYNAPLRRTISTLSATVDAPIVVGTYGVERGDSRDAVTGFNSVFLMTAAGFAGEPYHKQHLVPFVERIPFVDPAWLESITGDLRYFGGLGRGRGAEPMAVGDASFGVLICYESIFADLSRRFRRAGADFLVNATNDAWYGREEWYARTTALWQHPAHLAMRAIEERVGIARAANTGISMFVDPLGRAYERTALFEPDVRTATVYTTDELTLYARWGDWLATGAAITALVLMLATWWTGRDRSAASADTAPRIRARSGSADGT